MYSEAPDVEQLAETVIEENSENLQDCYGQPVKIKYLFKDSKKSTFLGKCCKATGKWAHLVATDYVIEIWLQWWKDALPNAKRALLFHELKHIQLVEKETPEGDLEISWKIRKHFAEIFHEEISLFGPWREEVAQIIDISKQI